MTEKPSVATMMNSTATFGDSNSGIQIGHNEGPITANIHLPPDPLSTGTSGGIISIGLQVCQEIFSGYQTWQGYDQEIQSIGSKAGSLLMPLNKLRDMIEDTRDTHPEISKDLDEKALSLKSCVERLQAKFVHHQIDSVSKTIPDRIRAPLRKTAYMFRKDTLREMSNDLDGIEQGLQTALAIYSTREIIGLVTSQEILMNELRQLRLMVTAGNKPPPGLIRSCCDHSYQQPPFAKASSVIKPWSTKGTGSAIFPRPEKSNAVARPYVYYSRLLRFVITASFSMSTGAGGFSIAPTLHMQFLRADDDWSYGLRNKWGSEAFQSPPRREFNQTCDDIICLFQQAFSEGRATPSDKIFNMSLDGPVSFVDLFKYVTQLEDRRDLVPGLHKLVRFLLHCGSKPDNSRGILRSLCDRILFQEEEYALATQLISSGGPLIIDASYSISFTEKRNMKYLLSRDEDSVSMPDIQMVILQESEKDLEDLLESGRILPSTKIGSFSILEFTFGWSNGVRMLLDAGANEQNSTFPLERVLGNIKDADPDHDGYYHSAEQLLEHGWTLSARDIGTCRSTTLRSLLIKELAGRRKRLWELAQSYLPPDKLPRLREGELLDIDAGYVYAVLVETGRKLDSSLRPVNPGVTVYHYRDLLSAETMEELYQAGFYGVDLPGIPGVAPLGSAGMTPIIVMNSYSSKRFVKALKWFISKGADVSRKLPGTNATVAQLLSERITIKLLSKQHEDTWDYWLQTFLLNKRKDSLVPFVRDACACACCPGGCTTLSVALREVFSILPSIYPAPYPAEKLRQLLKILIEWHSNYPKADQVLIRCFTFDALSLTHICCTGISPNFPHRSKSKDKSEIDDILEEEEERLKDLERLVSELEAKFEELGLPVLEFLEGYWHSYMIQFLSKLDPYNEEHHKEVRKLGVVLEVDERPVPYRLSLVIGAQIKEVINEELDGIEYWRPGRSYPYQGKVVG
ncbi:unnamed protein product [Penicillium crustosum]